MRALQHQEEQHDGFDGSAEPLTFVRMSELESEAAAAGSPLASTCTCICRCVSVRDARSPDT